MRRVASRSVFTASSGSLPVVSGEIGRACGRRSDAAVVTAEAVRRDRKASNASPTTIAQSRVSGSRELLLGDYLPVNTGARFSR